MNSFANKEAEIVLHITAAAGSDFAIDCLKIPVHHNIELNPCYSVRPSTKSVSDLLPLAMRSDELNA